MVMAMRGVTSEHPSQPAFLQDKGLNQGMELVPAKNHMELIRPGMKVTRVSSNAVVMMMVMVKMMSSRILSPESYGQALLSTSLLLSALICPMILCNRDSHYPRFSGEETEAQRGYITCLRSHS